MENKEQYMIRKLLVVAAAIAMPVSVVAVSGGLAGASNSHGSPATATVACKGLKGTLKFSPHLISTGDGTTAIKTAVSATLSKCTATGGVTVSGGAVSGTLTGAPGTSAKPSGTCAGLIGSATETGTLTIKWSPSSVPSSVLKVKSDTGSAAAGHGAFTIPGKAKSTASGSFLGGDKGAKDKSVAETSLTIAAINTACAKGITSLAIQNESSGTAVALG
jgi:hypothetical protein